ASGSETDQVVPDDPVVRPAAGHEDVWPVGPSAGSGIGEAPRRRAYHAVLDRLVVGVLPDVDVGADEAEDREVPDRDVAGVDGEAGHDRVRAADLDLRARHLPERDAGRAAGAAGAEHDRIAVALRGRLRLAVDADRPV